MRAESPDILKKGKRYLCELVTRTRGGRWGTVMSVNEMYTFTSFSYDDTLAIYYIQKFIEHINPTLIFIFILNDGSIHPSL